MKKILSSVLAIIMLFAICSCGGAGTGGVNTPKGITIGGCVVEYEGFEFLEVDGEDVIAIDYTFTNNNEYATSRRSPSMPNSSTQKRTASNR